MRRSFFVNFAFGLAVICTLGILFEARFANRAYYGVQVAGMNIAGKNREEIEKLLRARTDDGEVMRLSWGTSRFDVTHSQIGVEYDVAQTAAEALKYGRSGNLVADAREKIRLITGHGRNMPLIYLWDESKLTEVISEVQAQVNIPAREPEFSLGPDLGSVVVTNGEDGQEMDTRQLILDIRSLVGTAGSGEIVIEVKKISPKLTATQMSRAQRRAEAFVGKKLLVESPVDKQVWSLDDKQFFLWIDPTGEGFKIGAIENWLSDLEKSVNREPQNASFRFVSEGRVEEFRPARDGYTIQSSETKDLILGALADLENGAGEKKVIIQVRQTSPAVKTGDINDLGINELIGKGESWFSGSITNRIFNLQKAAAAMNGVLVPPGETFSFNKVIGDISTATGYKQAYVIKDGKTILGDGGGVCQVSSTLFRAVLNAGLPIDERIAHAYRVHYYEEKYEVGFDATVFQPSPDFKFRNDTPAYILIQTEFDEKNKHLVFSLYGTSDGRVSTVSKSRIWEITAPPPPLYQDDPTLPVGRVVQTEHAATGAKVAFDWKVTRNEETLQERTFYSNYRPWQAVYLRGTKVN